MLPGESLEAELHPHPLSWLGRYLSASVPALLGVALAAVFTSAWWQGAGSGRWYEVWTFLYGNTPMAFVSMFLGLAVAGAAIAVAAVRWRTFFLYISTGLVVFAMTFAVPWRAEAEIPLLLVLASGPLLVWSEVDRRSHKYTLTSLRILFRGGVVVTKERQLKYEAITDLDGSQGPLGRVLDYGTLIPVTQSGFGLGADTSQAGIVAGAGAGRGGLVGGAGVHAGGGKEVQVGRARTFHQLTGIRPYGETKHLLERLILEATATPYLREQVEIQRQMLEALERQGARVPHGPADDLPVFEGTEVD